MAEQPKEQQPKAKMLTEQDHLDRLTREIDRQRVSIFQHEIKHSFQTHGNKMAPEVTIRLLGGDLTNVQNLVLKIEEMVIQFAKDNPPVWPVVGPE